ncbi:phosphatidate cytidylyltransferase, mitochondrial [Coccinella septempunctata]|uniref:phosphatidate cytidylyltransferase, mitochondrial n=1 Tax=Coccinella septempunctata TaxID=41139 RepID=UPI001D07BC90|nr:phosphatidate cytidylyltransferase, mitochondrial [Coccinella septempunctata]
MPSNAVVLAPIFTRILARFPQQLNFCFAYGSAVKKQLTNNSKNNMIDLIFCVDNSSKWHELNIKQNPSHYSGLKYFGHNFISKFQENFGAKIYFNTLVPIEGVMIKYGVISTKDLITDLLEWSDIYLAGRLHKPVEVLKNTSNSELITALQLNLQSAVHSALLMLPESFTEYEFYHMLSNLSYAGDFRMIIGEKKNKVENIVKPQLKSFRQLYKPILKTLSDYVDFPNLKKDQSTGEDSVQNKIPTICSQDISPLAKLHHLNQLPRWPQKALTRLWNRGSLRQDTEDVLRAIAYDPDCNEIVFKCINQIVWKSSISQSVKGVATAGIFKSVQYSSKKLSKMII